MTRRPVLILGIICLVLAVLVASRFVRVHFFVWCIPSPQKRGGPVGERSNEIWQLEDGSNVRIDRSYFTTAGNKVTFHVEWQISADRLPKSQNREAMLEVVRSVLRHAFASGKMARTAVKVGTDGEVKVQLRAEVRGAGTQQTREIVVTEFDELLVWNWTFKGRAHRIFGPGYYLNRNNGKVTFTMKWHDPTLCPLVKGISDEAAFAIAEPVLRRAAAWRLWRVVPLVTSKGLQRPREHVDNVGLQLGCPNKNCKPGDRCGASGYRVMRPVEVLRAPPTMTRKVKLQGRPRVGPEHKPMRQ